MRPSLPSARETERCRKRTPRPLPLTHSPAAGQREEDLLQVREAQGLGWGGHQHPSDVSEGTSCSGSSGTQLHKPGALPSVYAKSHAPPAH